MTDTPPRTTHFGFETVDEADKARRVHGVFSSVASRYDVMNDLMSLGTHRLFKRMTVEMSGVRPGMRVLDLAAGTDGEVTLDAHLVIALQRVVVPKRPHDLLHCS